MRKVLKMMIPLALIASVLTGCMEQSEIEKQQNQKVENVNRLMSQTKVPNVTRSLERENVRQRILVSNDPNTLQWVYPMSSGRVIGRFPVKGKVTSGGKRLTATAGYNSSTSSSEELPDEMGTYGSSGEYIFWFDPAGRIHQHRGDYFLSPVPYKIDEGYGTISTEVDQEEEKKTTVYQKEIVETNKEMEVISKENEVSQPQPQPETETEGE
jgi:hypothetical protein